LWSRSGWVFSTDSVVDSFSRHATLPNESLLQPAADSDGVVVDRIGRRLRWP
jgi:hypothetical protein